MLEAYANLGACHLVQGRFAEALAVCQQALEKRPDFAPAHWNYSHPLLLLGRYEEGWREYEWRWQCPPLCDSRRDFSAPQWDGAPAPGRTILLHAEQGFGDAIQFVRYVPVVREHAGGARLILGCMPSLVRLLRESGEWGADIVADQGSGASSPPPFDLHIPLLSLPLALGMPEPLRMSAPYLRAGATLRVGIAWEGNPAHRNYLRRRVVPLEKFAALFQTPGAAFYSLQLSPTAAQSQMISEARVLDLTAHLTGFADTAALIGELDLVITVDTAVAHLAGAMGKAVWTFIPFVPDWRWGLEKDDTPWYPSMRLFRQPAIGDWDSVIARVATELRAMSDAQGGASGASGVRPA